MTAQIRAKLATVSSGFVISHEKRKPLYQSGHTNTPWPSAACKKMDPGGTYRPCAFAPHTSGKPSSDRENSMLYPTIFILWGIEPVCMAL
jgi:hypothetical protein